MRRRSSTAAIRSELTPTRRRPVLDIYQPTGWTASSLFPSSNQAAITHELSKPLLPAISLGGTPLRTTFNPSYFPWKNGYEGFQYRDDLSWTKGRHQFKFGVSWLHDYKNQELQANTNGTATFNKTHSLLTASSTWCWAWRTTGTSSSTCTARTGLIITTASIVMTTGMSLRG